MEMDGLLVCVLAQFEFAVSLDTKFPGKRKGKLHCISDIYTHRAYFLALKCQFREERKAEFSQVLT